MNLKLTGQKYNCLVPWYRVGSPLSIDTKNNENRSTYDVTMTFSNMAGLKKRIFSENLTKIEKTNHFFAKKVPNTRISPGFLLIKKGNGVSNIF